MKETYLILVDKERDVVNSFNVTDQTGVQIGAQEVVFYSILKKAEERIEELEKYIKESECQYTYVQRERPIGTLKMDKRHSPDCTKCKILEQK